MRLFSINRTFSVLLTLIIFFSCSKKENELTDTHLNKPLREAIVGYMSEPVFRNKDFVQQITGTEADLKLYDLDEQTLYFVINKTDYDSTTLDKLTIDKGAVEFGFEQNGDVFLGQYTLKGTGRKLFRFPKNDFKPDSNAVVKVKFNNGFEYIQNMNELADFADDKSIYGGKTNSEIKSNKYMASHIAFVSNGIEPSLKRLTDKIVKPEGTPEINYQLLLNFVTQQIEYSKNEAYGGYEILKRPNEVLMSGKSDCSGMVILYASLLEQVKADYILIYFKDHIAVGINGKYRTVNGLRVKFENKDYNYAECTVQGFKIGETEILEKDLTNRILFIQKPGKDSPFIDYKTGKPITISNE
ncbi:MAG: transglutaminase domain-containing protein [Ignavibacteria bacterium]|nr:transglutaminase domain-containing protein [Ignavibacteria bacterium]